MRSTEDERPKKFHQNDRVLIALRHCHRDFQGEGLSEKGRKQAEALFRYFAKACTDTSPLLLCSPKTRCRETIEPIALYCSKPAVVDIRLDEQQASETEKAFHDRIRKFAEEWRSGSNHLVTLLCSHGDWLPVFFQALTNEYIDLKQGGWAEIRIRSGHPVMADVIQDFGGRTTH